MKQVLHMDSTRIGGWIPGAVAGACFLAASLVFPLPLHASESVAADGITVPLQYQQVSFSPIGTSLSVTTESAAFKKEPALTKSKIRRGRFSLPAAGMESVAFLWDFHAHKLYVDLNGNGDLTDDPTGIFTSPDKATPGRNDFHFGTFQNIPLKVLLGAGRIPWLADLNFSEYGNSTRIYIYASAKCYWSGKVTLAGQDWEVGWLPAVFQRPGGRGADYLLMRAWAEHEQSFSTSDGSLDTFTMPSRLFVQSIGYELDCSHSVHGDTVDHHLTFREKTMNLGDLVVSGQYVQRLVLGGAACTAVYDLPSGKLRVPIGNYNLRQVQLGVGQSLAHLQEARESTLAIVPGRPTQLLIGGPLANSAVIQRRGNEMVIEYVLRGADGKTYQQPFRDYQHPPRFKIYRGDREIGSGNFEYG